MLYLKLTQHCKSTIHQYKKKENASHLCEWITPLFGKTSLKYFHKKKKKKNRIIEWVSNCPDISSKYGIIESQSSFLTLDPLSDLKEISNFICWLLPNFWRIVEKLQHARLSKVLHWVYLCIFAVIIFFKMLKN